MPVVQKIFSILVLVFASSFLYAQEDPVLHQRDSAVIPETDATVLFFQQNEKAASPANVSLVTKAGKSIKLSDFLKGKGKYADHVLADLDKDGKKELLVSNFTGGAHCCDEIYVFKNIAPNRYQHVVKFFAGHTTINKENEFVYNFSEQLGYFFTCYACNYKDLSDGAPIGIRSVVVKYNKGKLTVVPGNSELRNIINDNLDKLGELPYEELMDDMSQDKGQRKEFALNLAVFYYSFGKNILESQKLFNKYYKYPDAKKVWAAFTKTLLNIRKDSDF